MKLKAVIKGKRVHDVGYRVFLMGEAMTLGIQGFWAMNLTEDEKQIVIVRAEGDESQISEFRNIIKNKRPEGSDVDEVTFSSCDERVIDMMDYAHLLMAQQLSKGIIVLQKIDHKQDQMLDKQDQMLGKQDTTIGKLDEMKVELTMEIRSSKEAIIDEIAKTREAIVDEIEDSRTKNRKRTEERFSKIEGDIAQIKAKIGL